ncbi:hypothetical protein PVA45_01205 [Entomospira entomophila]|uniref:Uncharacterized protein n=1 Tax=Entomospira entomophila TaxID=2719988 RepID=A0A968GB41_9SPIO|nr:hypothetical protein [Entomospira entomophilus]NIZ40136.1 hypothetical protein [Entomospira entomophilus]WDI35695.1 hypothetical protein PVA45_01205 [Entomospira entomophilus]
MTLNDDLHFNVVSVSNLLKNETIMTLTTFALTAVLILLGLSLLIAIFYRLPEEKTNRSHSTPMTPNTKDNHTIFTQEETNEAMAHAQEEWLEEPSILKHSASSEDYMPDPSELSVQSEAVNASLDDIDWDIIDNQPIQNHDMPDLVNDTTSTELNLDQDDVPDTDLTDDFHLPEIDASFFDENSSDKLKHSDLDDLELPPIIPDDITLTTDMLDDSIPLSEDPLLLPPLEDLEYEANDPQELHFIDNEDSSELSLVESELEDFPSEEINTPIEPIDMAETSLASDTQISSSNDDLFNDPFEDAVLSIMDTPQSSTENSDFLLDPPTDLEEPQIFDIPSVDSLEDPAEMETFNGDTSNLHDTFDKETMPFMNQPPHRETFISQLTQSLTECEEITVILLQQEDPSSNLFQLLLQNHLAKHYPEIILEVEQSPGRYALLIENQSLSQSLIFIEDLHDTFETQELYFYIGASSKSARNISAKLLYQESLQALEKAINSGERGAMIAFKSNSDQFDPLTER